MNFEVTSNSGGILLLNLTLLFIINRKLGENFAKLNGYSSNSGMDSVDTLKVTYNIKIMLLTDREFSDICDELSCEFSGMDIITILPTFGVLQKCSGGVYSWGWGIIIPLH